ncbi:hypothetical protein BX666DRAFT_1883944 [Dichotomocladium elegans]|nr:hypothetical protein BX666DRAFT_1883944 [Dichotomocladium elegans]
MNSFLPRCAKKGEECLDVAKSCLMLFVGVYVCTNSRGWEGRKNCTNRCSHSIPTANFLHTCLIGQRLMQNPNICSHRL